MPFCGQCGANQESGLKFCPECGATASGSGDTAAKHATKKCPYCAETILQGAVKCRFCGENLLTPSPIAFAAAPGMSSSADLPKFAQEFAWSPPPATSGTKQWNPGIAAVLSLIVPGAGQIYKGQIGRGLAWFAGTFIGYMAMVVPGIAVHIICIYNAYNGEAE